MKVSTVEASLELDRMKAAPPENGAFLEECEGKRTVQIYLDPSNLKILQDVRDEVVKKIRQAAPMMKLPELEKQWELYAQGLWDSRGAIRHELEFIEIPAHVKSFLHPITFVWYICKKRIHLASDEDVRTLIYAFGNLQFFVNIGITDVNIGKLNELKSKIRFIKNIVENNTYSQYNLVHDGPILNGDRK